MDGGGAVLKVVPPSRFMASEEGNEVNYLDLIILAKLDADSTVEKFGSQINTSFFETANLMGTLKIKGLLDIQSSIGGRSPLILTGEGKDVLTQATARSQEPLDTLDQAILHALAGGVRLWPELMEAINIRSRDLAFHLYKLKAGDYIDHEVRSGKVSFSLTEKGFNITGGVRVRTPTSAASAPGASASAGSPPSSPAKPHNIANSFESEINDILNFGGFVKKKEATANGGKAAAPVGSISSPISRSATPASAPLSDPGASPSSASSPSSSSPASSSMTGSATPVSMPGMDAKPRLDRTSMLLSKIEFYAQNYWLYGVLVLLLLALVAYALVVGILPRPGV